LTEPFAEGYSTARIFFSQPPLTSHHHSSWDIPLTFDDSCLPTNNVTFNMETAKNTSDHIEDAGHEAALTGVVALASLFSLCVETFGLIHPSHKWDKEEQRQIARLGLQQTRLLVWGYVLGIASPPTTVTDRAVPRNPSLVYPEPSEPTFFGARDPRLDEPGNRTVIEDALSAIVDRTSGTTREEMMAKYGLKPPRKISIHLERPLDPARLEAFRERHELLHEVAQKYAHLDTTRRAGSLIRSSWQIADCTKFAAFISATQERIDMLIDLLQVKTAVDRAVSMDIRSFGWHVIPDRERVGMDLAKLRLLHDICLADYPEYVPAVKQALDHIGREDREFSAPNAEKAFAMAVAAVEGGGKPGATNANSPAAMTKKADQLPAPAQQAQQVRKRPTLLSFFRSSIGRGGGRRSSLDNKAIDSAARSKSDAGVFYTGHRDGHTATDSSQTDDDTSTHLTHVRSKSLGEALPAIDDASNDNNNNHFSSSTAQQQQKQQDPLAATPRSLLAETQQQQQQQPQPQVKQRLDITATAIAPNLVIRHDQYHGLARTDTQDLHQGDY
jgi:hypothetical protein